MMSFGMGSWLLLPSPTARKTRRGAGSRTRAALLAAREHDRGGPGVVEGVTRAAGLVQPARHDHRRRRGLVDQLLGEVVVGPASVLLVGMAWVEGEAGHAGLVDEPLGQLDAVAVAGL